MNATVEKTEKKMVQPEFSAAYVTTKTCIVCIACIACV